MKASVIVLVVAVFASCGHAQPQAEGMRFYAQGQMSFRAANYTAASSNFSRCIELDPGNPEPYCRRAACRQRLGDYAGAVVDYNQAIQISPRDSAYYCERGQARFELRDFTGALGDYNQAIKRDMNNTAAYIHRGQLALTMQTNLSGAVADFTRAIQLHTEPQEAELYAFRGKAKATLGELAGAMDDYRKALQLDPKCAMARTNLASAEKNPAVRKTSKQ